MTADKVYVYRCDHCHERKVRCDKTQPCRRCRLGGLPCHYTDRSKGRTYSQAHVENLERKVKRLESQNKVLVQRSTSTAPPSGSPGAPVVHHAPGPDASNAQRGGLSSDVTGEVSYLTINASGERHYLGSSSGVLLANFIKANVDIESSTRPTSPPREAEASITTASAAELGRDLPSESVARRLVLSYLNHDHLCYPVVQPATLLALLSEIYSTNKVLYAQQANEAFIFDIALAIATASMSRSDSHGLPSAHSHYTRAMSRASRVLEMGGLGGLQAIVLLLQYRMRSSMKDTSASKLTSRTKECVQKQHVLIELSSRHVASGWDWQQNCPRAWTAPGIRLSSQTFKRLWDRPHW